MDGKRRYGDGLYQQVVKILGISLGDLRNMKYIADLFELSVRNDKVSWRHHYEVASIETLEYDGRGKLEYSKKPDAEKIQELLDDREWNEFPEVVK